MKLKSVSGTTCYVENLDKTIKFYEELGFVFKNRGADYATAYLNWFSMEFVLQDKAANSPEFQKEAKLKPRGGGFFLNISVENVDEAHQYLIDKGYKPSSQPRDWPWGTREFVIRDPDGYKLVIFKRQKPRNPAE